MVEGKFIKILTFKRVAESIDKDSGINMHAFRETL
jgi:hypothetical protein